MSHAAAVLLRNATYRNSGSSPSIKDKGNLNIIEHIIDTFFPFVPVNSDEYLYPNGRPTERMRSYSDDDIERQMTNTDVCPDKPMKLKKQRGFKISNKEPPGDLISRLEMLDV